MSWPKVPEMVAKMYQAQNGKCGYCGSPDMFIRKDVSHKHYQRNRPLMATFEHVKLDKDGGKYVLDNGVCVCSRCNGLRADLPIAVFFERYDELLRHLLEKPARDAAKRKLNDRKTGYIIAWFARRTGQTVADIFLDYTPRNSYDLARGL
jgi:5-methylcytosine-specific restriction endonuclease McrA